MNHLASSAPLGSVNRREFLRRSTVLGGAAALAGCGLTADRAGDRWQIGCYTRPFDQHDYRTALDAIAEAGYRHCGIMTAKGKTWVVVTVDTPVDEARQVGDDARQRGLRVLSLYGGDFPVAKSVAAGVEGLRRLIDNAAACGAPNLMLGGVGEAKLYEAYFKVVAECCAYAAAKGVGLSMKPHGGLNATGAQCRQAVERVGHPNFRVWYDPGNIFYYSDGALDPAEDAASVDGLVVGMSVKDFLPPKEVLVTPGEGRVNFPKVLARLRQGGFTRGPLIVECVKRGDLRQVVEEARKARLFVENLLAQRGA
jgi:sugar phosphate isomerase/epimerase